MNGFRLKLAALVSAALLGAVALVSGACSTDEGVGADPGKASNPNLNPDHAEPDEGPRELAVVTSSEPPNPIPYSSPNHPSLSQELPRPDLPPPTDEPDPDYAAHFVRYTVDGRANNPAFVSVADLDDDGKSELVVSSFGSGLSMRGAVTVYDMGDDLDSWSKQVLVGAGASTQVKFPNWTTVRDLDHDGDLDVLVPAGFLACAAIPLVGSPCGGLFWLEQTPAGWERHDIVPTRSELFYHHVEIADLNGDGYDDIVTVGEKKGGGFSARGDRAEVHLFLGTNAPQLFHPVPRVLGSGMGSHPTLTDVDHDGDLDIISAEFFVAGGSFAWMEQRKPLSEDLESGEWRRHVIADDLGRSIMFALVPNLCGDGLTRAVGANHTNTYRGEPESGVFLFDLPPGDPTEPWENVMISQGMQSVRGSAMAPMAAPGIFGWGDVDGDGDLDLVVSGDGDKRVFVLEQNAPCHFVTQVLQDNFGQAGGMRVVDLDADGNAEIVVTGYEANVLYIYEWQG